MYKLFLCLRYLRSRVIAYFSMLGVAICVFMVLVAVSVMNGFLHKIELAAKGLFGDIVVEAEGQQGMAHYDELIEAMKKDVPEVQAASPVIFSMGMLQLPGQGGIRVQVQIAGVRLPQQAQVTDFAKGLFAQAGLNAPTFDPPLALMLGAIRREVDKTNQLLKTEESKEKSSASELSEARMINKLFTAESYQEEGARNLLNAEQNAKQLQVLEDRLTKAEGVEANSLEERVRFIQSLTIEPPGNRVILGLGLQSLSFRTEDGQTVRYMVPGSKIVLTLIPLGRQLNLANLSPAIRFFTVVDDCRTDVSSIDSEFVYVPFETLQVLNNLDSPSRCNQINIKVGPQIADEGQLRAVAHKIEESMLRYRKNLQSQLEAGDANDPAVQQGLRDMQYMNFDVLTWRQRQEPIIHPIQSQKTLVALMFIIISSVAVVLIFVIFYMIVLQKTREIGVLKAVGASSGGVAAIFLAYGAIVGVIGAVVGSTAGWFLVKNINPVHDWLGRVLGFQVWDRKTFLFEKIPNEINPADVAMIVAGAILAGLVGALWPAIRAARMQPVEALRYE